MAKDKVTDDMPTQHCRVGIQHRMTMAECAKYDAGADTTEETPPDDSGESET
jgi:hypothetical protein